MIPGRTLLLLGALLALSTWNAARVAVASQTTYTLPQDLHWIPDRTGGAPPGAFYAILRGMDSDKCGELIREKFPNGFVYPWHVNNTYNIITVLSGTLVVGFDKHHRKSAERVLPAGSVIQGLKTEPHYGRAIGETIFDAYGPPCEMLKT
jgi:hypothetical protein